MARLLLLLFLLVPLAELYLLIQVGKVIGAGWTILLVVATALLGALLMQRQGLDTLQRARSTLDRGEVPALEMLEGLALIASAALLLTPGFMTDMLGFLLLLPPLRRRMLAQLLKRSRLMFSVRSAGFYRRETARDGSIIEGEVVNDDPSRHLR